MKCGDMQEETEVTTVATLDQAISIDYLKENI
jgi:hypothetical protein